MDEDKPGDSGAANTPPFPRLVSEAGASPDPSASGDRDSQSGEPAKEASSSARPTPENGPESFQARRGGPAEGQSFRHSAADLESTPGGKSTRPRFPQQRRLGAGAFEHLADHVEEVAARLDAIAQTRLRGSPAGASSAVAHVTNALDGVADYLRSSDLDSARADLEAQVRTKPLQTLLVAVGAGWLTGKILR